MKTTFLLTIFSAILFLSCGKSKYEKEFDKAMDDYEKAVDNYEREMDKIQYDLDSYDYY
jgi:hypothetical protein